MGKSSSMVVGFHYRPAFHVGLGRGEFDAYLEFRAADKTAWAGELTASGRIHINQPMLFGGEKDQGGIVGAVDIMFGEADQLPNAYLTSVFGNQTVAWRGVATLAFLGGRYGAMNPMPQKPAHKIRKILKGWDGDDCWYPEKAEVAAVGLRSVLLFVERFESGATGWEITAGGSGAFSVEEVDGRSWMRVGPVPGARIQRVIDPTPLTRFRARVRLLASPADDWAVMDINHSSSGAAGIALGRQGNSNRIYFGWTGFLHVVEGDPLQLDHTYLIDMSRDPASGSARLLLIDETSNTVWADFTAEESPPMDIVDRIILRNDVLASEAAWSDIELYGLVGGGGINPAHALYYVRTDSEKGREPRANINEASLKAAADRLHVENFGLCQVEYDPRSDTPDSVSERICQIIGGSFESSLVDGQWYLDLARKDYDLESLPIIGDADILSISEQTTTLDKAVNCLGLRYFDIQRKEMITIWARAPGLIRRFGEKVEILEWKEIPNASLAARVVERELRARITPTRTFDLVTNPRPGALRRSQNFRLQTPKRRIGDMVCIVGEKQHGTLASGAIQWKVSQHVYSMSDVVLVEVEHGVDTRPPQTPTPIELQRVFEAPYIDVAANLPRAELEALPNDVGYLLAVAADPAQHLNYTMAVQPDGGEYSPVANGEWCPTATVNELADRQTTEFTLADARRLDVVEIGAPVLWDEEWCRVDTLDREADPVTITLGRACADTVPTLHAPGSRLWFPADHMAIDVTEYTGGETVNAKLLSNTGSQQLQLDSATALALTLAGRQARPYPPADVRLNGESYPSMVVGDVEITAYHRDRLLQADQLVDQTVGDIGPEPGTTYVVRNFNLATDTETYYADGIAGFPHVVPAGELAAANRLEIYSVRDGLESWQRIVVQFTGSAVLLAEDGSPITDEEFEPIQME